MEIKFTSNNANIFAFRALKNPIRLDEALYAKKIDNKDFDLEDVFIKEISKNEELASTPIIDLIGQGSCAIAFETKDGRVLKMTRGSHFPLGRKQEDFDVPIYKQGKIGKINYYIEEKLMQHDMPEEFLYIMQDMIVEKGLEPYDLEFGSTRQIGLSSEGKLYLIDPECARHKTVFHALFYQMKNSFVKLYKKSLNFNKQISSHFSKALRK